MNYYTLKSILSASKSPIPMSKPSQSFCVARKPDFQFIEPSFIKEAFETEKPAVILISASGATGKTSLANVLSHQLSMPILDLGKHKPVGDNTLTGLIADSFDVNDLSKVFEAFQKGTFGIIIDGVDEGRAQVTEKAFEAFLDDIAQRCKGTLSTSFVLLGRTNVLEDCWLYLMGKGTSTGLISIQPFDLPSARSYIDALTGGMNSRFIPEYQAARDSILELLSTAFHGKSDIETREFLPFIGYPPVLDAIATLLKGERDYHRLSNSLAEIGATDLEIELLSRIAEYILGREKDQKVVPNILSHLVKEMPTERQHAIVESAYNIKEQCHRLVSFCLGKSIKMSTFSEKAINDRYEDQITQFLPEHPFISMHSFRNAVFESFALAKLMASNDPECVPLALGYADSHKHSYHLVNFLNYFASQNPLQIEYLQVVLESAYEFHGSNTSVDIHVDSPNAEEGIALLDNNVEAEIEIDIGGDESKSKRFDLIFEAKGRNKIHLGQKLSSTYVRLPCEVILSAPEEIELTAPVYIEATALTLASGVLIIRNPPKSSIGESVEIVIKSIDSSLLNIRRYGADLQFVVPQKRGLAYPIFDYAIEEGALPSDQEISEKYLRLKRILVEFRSHSRGQLARAKVKIENPRILRNDTGKAILRQLIRDGIITLRNVHYFLDSDKLGTLLGISWQDLRTNRIDNKLRDYLKEIHI